jgi:hypothetical protein
MRSFQQNVGNVRPQSELFLISRLLWVSWLSKNHIREGGMTDETKREPSSWKAIIDYLVYKPLW